MSTHDNSRPSFDAIISELAGDERILSASEKSLLARIVHHGQTGAAPAETASFLRRLRQAIDGAVSERVMRVLASGVTERAFGSQGISPMFPEPMFPGPLFPPDPFFRAQATANMSPMFPEPDLRMSMR